MEPKSEFKTLHCSPKLPSMEVVPVYPFTNMTAVSLHPCQHSVLSNFFGSRLSKILEMVSPSLNVYFSYCDTEHLFKY